MTRLGLIVALVLLGVALTLEFKRLTIKPWPPQSFSDAELHFKYGSIGAEVHGYPYLIWRELPAIFPERIPKGLAEFGFITEANRELPIGISVRRYGVSRVGFNCATCHTSIVTWAGSRQIVLGAPAEQLDLQAYIQFLISASADPRLNAQAVFESARRNGRPIGLFDRMVIKYVVFKRLGHEIDQLKAMLAWMDRRPAHGPGRTDAGNFWRARWGLKPEQDEGIGTVDFPSVWNQRIRLQGSFHWDGNNSSLDERNISAALAGGTAEWLLDRNSIGRVSDWLLDLRPPVFPAQIDTKLAAAGKIVYDRTGCGSCHDLAGHNIGKVTALSILQTDPERIHLFSEQMVQNFENVGAAYSWQFQHYRTTEGYVNVPLDGIWVRGPFLHNGSVPTLAALLSPGTDRPRKFVRGCSTLDPRDVGFLCERGFEFDTTQPGNGNGGHEYGTSLHELEKGALLEYLKTL